jgi:hypothetical protein
MCSVRAHHNVHGFQSTLAYFQEIYTIKFRWWHDILSVSGNYVIRVLCATVLYLVQVLHDSGQNVLCVLNFFLHLGTNLQRVQCLLNRRKVQLIKSCSMFKSPSLVQTVLFR